MPRTGPAIRPSSLLSSRQLSHVALWATLLLLMPRGAVAQDERDPSPHSDAELVAEVTSVQPGTPFHVGLRLLMDEHWHSYWINPGDAGMMTRITWTGLPEGFEAGEIQWPHPDRIDVPPLRSYGYSDEVLLLVELTPPADLPAGSDVTFQARADWLICAEVCLPAKAEVSLTLPVTAAAPSLDAAWHEAFEATRTLHPVPVAETGWTVEATPDSTGYTLLLTPPAGADAGLDDVYFFVSASGTLEHAAPQPVRAAGDRYLLDLKASPYAQDVAERLDGVLVAPDGAAWNAGGDRPALAVDMAVQPDLVLPAASAAVTTSAAGGLTLWFAIILAFTGGLLLNLMPCVFPVLSFKILGFVEQSGQDPARIRRHGYVFGLGVLLSFLVLAGALLLLRAGGSQIGWGFQLQSPAFVALIALLLFAIGLNFMGVFEVGLSMTRLGGAAGGAKGYRDSFLSGILATIVATPCTAPFMGAAMGFAIVQPPVYSLLVFGVLGIGMALPYVVLSMSPKLIQRLPRQGPWMETFKQVLAFPMFATVVWLIWVFGQQTGIDGAAALLMAFTLLALAAWIIGRWSPLRITPRTRLITRTVAALAFAGAIALALQGAANRVAPGSPVTTVADPTTWRPFQAEHIAQLEAEGKPYFIDFTAAWCLTCQVNKRVALSDRAVLQAFRDRDVALFRADWTNQDPAITRALESYGRSGVPVYVLHPGSSAGAPLLLPELLTAGMVLDALEAVPASPTLSSR